MTPLKTAQEALEKIISALRLESATLGTSKALGIARFALTLLQREGEERADQLQEVVAALYKAWPDAEDIPSDWPLGIVGCIEQIIAERDGWKRIAEDRLASANEQLAGRRAAEAELAKAKEIVDLARELVSPAGMVNRGVDRGLVVVEKRDKSDPHYRLCAALEIWDRQAATLSPEVKS